jgi:hypothetical protein
MATQRFMGRGQLIDRLTAQVGNRGLAIGILKKRGQLNADGTLTKSGMKRNNMTAEERAKSRASKETGKSPDSFTYNPATNRTKIKR